VDAIWVPIVVAVIGGPLMWLLARFDRRNTEQHGENMRILKRVEGKVDRLDTKIDRVDDRLWTHMTDKDVHSD
jgi:hypothetical protein